MSDKTLLFCNPLSDSKAEWLRKETNVSFQIEPLIRFEYKPISDWLPAIEPKFKIWVFTSKRAANAVLKSYNELAQPEAVYCVGPTTASYFDGFPFPVFIPMEFNSEALIKLVAQDNVRNAVHFKGNLSGDDLVESLMSNGVIAKGIEVYQTLKNPKSVDCSKAAGMVFMSPSAIEAFVEMNHVESNKPVFCIGETTGAAARESGFEEVIIPENYAFESLVQTIKTYFNE